MLGKNLSLSNGIICKGILTRLEKKQTNFIEVVLGELEDVIPHTQIHHSRDVVTNPVSSPSGAQLNEVPASVLEPSSSD